MVFFKIVEKILTLQFSLEFSLKVNNFSTIFKKQNSYKLDSLQICHVDLIAL